MYERTVWMLNALAVLGVVASVAAPVLVYVTGRDEAPPPAYPFLLLSGLTASLVLRAVAILVHVAADTRRRIARLSGDGGPGQRPGG